MENKTATLESLLERAEEYGKTSLELIKLKALDIVSDVFSSFLSRLLMIVTIFLFFGFLNLGVTLWLGTILGKTYYGFFIVASFYGIAGIFLYAFMGKWIKIRTANFFIKQVLNNDKWEK